MSAPRRVRATYRAGVMVVTRAHAINPTAHARIINPMERVRIIFRTVRTLDVTR